MDPERRRCIDWLLRRQTPEKPDIEAMVRRAFDDLRRERAKRAPPPNPEATMASDVQARLRSRAIALRCMEWPKTKKLARADAALDEEAADALAAQAAEIERLKKERDETEAERADQWRRRRDVEGVRDTLQAALGTVRDERDALAARVAELEGALRQIEEWEPATQEVTLAHQMADLARAALHPKAPAPAGEGGAS